MDTTNCILTFSGQYVDLAEPDLDAICISDIAHALSQLTRFGGHTRQFYSVAQHSVLVSQCVSGRYRLRALLHDAAEAYFGDMVQPLKIMACSSEYRRQERAMQAAIYHRFGCGSERDEEGKDDIHHADLVMLATERRDLMAPDSVPWSILTGIHPRQAPITPLMPIAAEALFLRRFKELSGVL